MKVYLLRHGQTEYNADKRYQGTAGHPAFGQRGAPRCGRADIDPDTVYVSPLQPGRGDGARVLFPGRAARAGARPAGDVLRHFRGAQLRGDGARPRLSRLGGRRLYGPLPGRRDAGLNFPTGPARPLRPLVDEALARGAGNAGRHGARRHPDGGDGAVRLPAPGLLHLVRGQRGRLCAGCGALADAPACWTLRAKRVMRRKREMDIVLAALCGFLMDLALGDPAWMPHPVVGMGKCIAALERGLRRAFPQNAPGRACGGRGAGGRAAAGHAGPCGGRARGCAALRTRRCALRWRPCGAGRRWPCGACGTRAAMCTAR